MGHWADWHEGYADPGSALTARLSVVQGFIRQFLDSRPDERDIRVLSLCAGKGVDLLGVLADHPASSRVRARLIELEPALVDAARASAHRLGLEGVETVAGDASVTDSYRGAVPADLLLVCGVFGNISDADVERTIRALPHVCAARGTVIWTRHTWQPDLTTTIRGWLAEAGFAELAFESPGPDAYAVGAHEFTGKPRALEPGKRLFTFDLTYRASPLRF